MAAVNLDLYPVCLSTSEDDLNWIQWLVIAHPDEDETTREKIEELVVGWEHQWPMPAAERERLYYNDSDEFDRQRIADFLAYAEAHGYTTLRPGRLDWFCTKP